MSVFRAVSQLESNDHLHLGRLLILIWVFSEGSSSGVTGLTKLAKLDFLLRYPTYLERALRSKGRNEDAAHVEDFERMSVESSMVRFRYGPWDHRYRRFVNTLVAKGLVEITSTGRTFTLSATNAGAKAAVELADHDPFQPIVKRTRLLKSSFNIGGTNLMRFIYDTFPEITSLRFDEEIPI